MDEKRPTSHTYGMGAVSTCTHNVAFCLILWESSKQVQTEFIGVAGDRLLTNINFGVFSLRAGTKQPTRSKARTGEHWHIGLEALQ
eukprot:12698-Amphidinium_carterae.1